MMAPPYLPRPDVDQVRTFWEGLLEPGDIHEIRILGARRGPLGWRTGATYSGWFDDVEALLRVLSAVTGEDAEGVYITLNPVDRSLLARRANRLDFAGKMALTSDGDVTRRKALLIDCDAVRHSGISATEEELALALTVRDQVREYLADCRWPQPIIAGMSGNGGHLIYRLDLPPRNDTIAFSWRNVLLSLHTRSGVASF